MTIIQTESTKCTKAMATGILLICVLNCGVATSVGDYTDYSKAFDELSNEFRKSQEEVQSLHQKINILGKRLSGIYVYTGYVPTKRDKMGRIFLLVGTYLIYVTLKNTYTCTEIYVPLVPANTVIGLVTITYVSVV